MSRNLADTICRICGEEPKLDGEPHRILASECGSNFFGEYDGLIVCNARCPNCDAKYLAWVDASANRCLNCGHWKRTAHDERPFVDLSFRRSFNDEPAAEDLPTPECLQRIHERECIARAREHEKRADEERAEAQRIYDEAATGRSHWEAFRRES